MQLVFKVEDANQSQPFPTTWTPRIGPKPPTGAQKAIVVHTFGVQVLRGSNKDLYPTFPEGLGVLNMEYLAQTL